MDKRAGIIRKASWVGIVGNAVLSVSKITAGLLSGSFALLGDGIDSATDIVTSAVTLLTSKISDQPPDEVHPYGHGRAETVATKVLSFIIFFAGAQLGFSTVRRLATGAGKDIPEFFAIYFVVASIFGKAGLAWYKYRAGRAAQSSMLIADAKNMLNDVLISFSVLAGLVFTFVFKMPVLDIITALLVSIWIMKVAFGIFIETSTELMDGLDDRSIYDEVIEIVCNVGGVRNPHKMRIRKMNTKYIIDMDIEVDGDITVTEGHAIAKNVHDAIENCLDNVYDVNIHVEPFGNQEKSEKYGLS